MADSILYVIFKKYSQYEILTDYVVNLDCTQHHIIIMTKFSHLSIKDASIQFINIHSQKVKILMTAMCISHQ